MSTSAVIRIVRQAMSEWLDDNAPRIGAALAFYILFAIAPLLVICMAVAGMIFGEDAARGHLLRQANDLVGADAGAALQAMLASAAKPQVGLWATIVSVVMTFVGAIGLFGELQAALNTIWNVRPRPDRGWRDFFKDRLISFAMIFGSALLLLAMLIASTILAGITSQLNETTAEVVSHYTGPVVTFLILTLLFAMIYRVLPDVQLAWRDVWLGALITAALFSAGNFAIAVYLGQSAIHSAYGAAGSLAVLLAWLYYAAQVFLAGAEITQVYTKWHGSGIVPSPNAERCDDPSCQEPTGNAKTGSDVPPANTRRSQSDAARFPSEADVSA